MVSKINADTVQYNTYDLPIGLQKTIITLMGDIINIIIITMKHI